MAMRSELIPVHRIPVIVSVALFLLISLPAASQTTWHVDDNAPDDPGPGNPSVSDPLEDGSEAHPFDAIQEGINAAGDHDTVLVSDGTYTGVGNYNIHTFHKEITIRSENGPDNCIVDAQNIEGHRCFTISVRGVVDGFTITRGNEFDGGGVSMTGSEAVLKNCVITSCVASQGGGVECYQTSLVTGCIIENNQSTWTGGGIQAWNGGGQAGDVLIYDNIIRNNFAWFAGGGVYTELTPTRIHNNIISGNTSDHWGGGIGCSFGTYASIINNLITDNHADLGIGGGIGCNDGSESELLISSNTITGNTATNYGGGIDCDNHTLLTVTDTILWGNEAPHGNQISVDENSTLRIQHSDVWGGQDQVSVASGATLNWGEGMIDADPLFASGPRGDHCLGQLAAGQPAQSPCVNTGSLPASEICFETAGGTACMDTLSTRTDGFSDGGRVDMGFHCDHGGLQTVDAGLACLPGSGTLPFVTSMTASLTNSYLQQKRRIAANIRLNLASGRQWGHWRAGYTQLDPGESNTISWNQTIPALGTLVGINSFTLFAQDVTPAPYNQPPYLPAGDMETAVCTLEGVAP